MWGRVRLSVENAVDNAQVSAADLENIRLSQQALLATDYFLMAAQDMQIKVLSDTIQAYEKNLQLTINRYNGGVASKSDITLAQTQLAGAKAQSTDMHIARAQDEHAIAVLTGRPPASLEIGDSKIAGAPPPIPLGVPSQLLERRPDIAANERQVAAANANVGIAETAYYPTLTLSASLGLLANNLPNLFTYASRSWSAGPSLSQTLFDFGRRGAALENAQAAYDATVAAYRQTVLSAFQEVEDDLANLRYLCRRGGAGAGSGGSRPAGAGPRDGTVSGGNRFLSERHHDPDHRIRRPADRHHHPAAADDCGSGSRQGARRRLGRLDVALGQCSSYGRAGRSEEHAKCGAAGGQISGTRLSGGPWGR